MLTWADHRRSGVMLWEESVEKTESPREERLAGTLLGTALGDALGLPAEGMTARAIARRFGRVDRFLLWAGRGYVSDDTEQAALIADCLARYPADVEGCAAAFRRALLRWSLCLPFGAGRATLRACARIGLGLQPSGVRSAGNGAAMRAPVIGVYFADQPELRRAYGTVLAECTHRDTRAVDAALFASELAGACSLAADPIPRAGLVETAVATVGHAELRDALERAIALARQQARTDEAAQELGTSGYAVHTVALTLHAFLRFGSEPLTALTETISAGGDTDTRGAILGAWLGALHGEAALPADLLARIHDGPCGPTHLRSLARTLASVRQGHPADLPRVAYGGLLARNLALFPVILGHGFRRLLPW